jgi:hypothetical protein
MGDELLDLWGPVFTIAYYAIGIPICWLARPYLSLTSGPPFLIRLFFPFLRSTSLPFAGKELLCSEKLRVVGRSSRHATKLDPGLEFRKPRNVEENRNETFSHGYSR